MDGREQPTRRGISLRQGNFGKLLQALGEQLDLAPIIRDRNAFLVESCIELLLRQMMLNKARDACAACDTFLPRKRREHLLGCLAAWAQNVEDLFILEDCLTELVTEAEALYNSILPDITFVKGKRPLPHAFSHLYGKYFNAYDDEAAVRARIVLPLYGPCSDEERVMVMDKLCVRVSLSADDLEHFQKK